MFFKQITKLEGLLKAWICYIIALRTIFFSNTFIYFFYIIVSHKSSEKLRHSDLKFRVNTLIVNNTFLNEKIDEFIVIEPFRILFGDAAPKIVANFKLGESSSELNLIEVEIHIRIKFLEECKQVYLLCFKVLHKFSECVFFWIIGNF